MEGAFLKKRTKKGKLLNYFGQKSTFFSYFFLLRPTKWVYFFLLYFCLGFSFTLFLFSTSKTGALKRLPIFIDAQIGGDIEELVDDVFVAVDGTFLTFSGGKG